MARINREAIVRYVRSHPRVSVAVDEITRFIRAHPRISVAVDEVTRFTRAHPRISTAVAFLVCFAVASALHWHFTNNWRRYEVEAVGISVELPSPPKQTSDPAEAGLNVVYESQTRRAAILLAGQELPADVAPGASLGRIASTAMEALKLQQGIDDLKYELRLVLVDGRDALRVKGMFRRDGAPAGVAGFVGKSAEGRSWQALTFFNDLEGSQICERVLRSVKLMKR